MPRLEAEEQTPQVSNQIRKKKQVSFSQMVEVTCFCQWHRMFFLKSDFMDDKNREDIHLVLEKHAKIEHPTAQPFFNVRTANYSNNKFQIT